jgi:hypothetical protein
MVSIEMKWQRRQCTGHFLKSFCWMTRRIHVRSCPPLIGRLGMLPWCHLQDIEESTFFMELAVIQDFRFAFGGEDGPTLRRQATNRFGSQRFLSCKSYLVRMILVLWRLFWTCSTMDTTSNWSQTTRATMHSTWKCDNLSNGESVLCKACIAVTWSGNGRDVKISMICWFVNAGMKLKMDDDVDLLFDTCDADDACTFWVQTSYCTKQDFHLVVSLHINVCIKCLASLRLCMSISELAPPLASDSRSILSRKEVRKSMWWTDWPPKMNLPRRPPPLIKKTNVPSLASGWLFVSMDRIRVGKQGVPSRRRCVRGSIRRY